MPDLDKSPRLSKMQSGFIPEGISYYFIHVWKEGSGWILSSIFVNLGLFFIITTWLEWKIPSFVYPTILALSIIPGSFRTWKKEERRRRKRDRTIEKMELQIESVKGELNKLKPQRIEREVNVSELKKLISIAEQLGIQWSEMKAHDPDSRAINSPFTYGWGSKRNNEVEEWRKRFDAHMKQLEHFCTYVYTEGNDKPYRTFPLSKIASHVGIVTDEQMSEWSQIGYDLTFYLQDHIDRLRTMLSRLGDES